MAFCLFILTVGQFFPIYFIDRELADIYYIIIFVLLLISVGTLIFKKLYVKNSIYYAGITACVSAIGICLIFIFIRFIGSIAIWQDATILYTKRNNSDIKIITRYVNEGAFGGGTEPGDYEIVLKRSILSVLKIETKIDTNEINKSEWVKKVYNKYDTDIMDN